MLIGMISDAVDHDVLHQFASNAYQRHWTVINGFEFISLLIDWTDKCSFPDVRYFTSSPVSFDSLKMVARINDICVAVS